MLQGRWAPWAIPGRCRLWCLGLALVLGCGKAGPAPPAPAAEPQDSAPPLVLHAAEPAGRSLEVKLDDETLGYVAIADLAAPVQVIALLPSTFSPEQWYSLTASAGARTFHLEDPTRTLPGAVPWLVAKDGRFSVQFVRPANAELPEHIRKLAATPAAGFDDAAVLHLRSRKPEFDEPANFLLVATLDGWSHGVADSALQALPPLADPERPDKEGNWRSLDALLASLPGPDTSAAEVVVIGRDEPVVLSAELRRTHAVLLKRNKKAKVRLRVYPRGEGKQEPVTDVTDVLQIRVRNPGDGARQ